MSSITTVLSIAMCTAKALHVSKTASFLTEAGGTRCERLHGTLCADAGRAAAVEGLRRHGEEAPQGGGGMLDQGEDSAASLSPGNWPQG